MSSEAKPSRKDKDDAKFYPNPKAGEVIQSPAFRTVSGDYVYYSISNEQLTLKFYTDHVRHRDHFEDSAVSLEPEGIVRELQVEVRMPLSVGLSMLRTILSTYERLETEKTRKVE